MYVCVPHVVCAGVLGGQKRESDPLELSYRLFQVAQYLESSPAPLQGEQALLTEESSLQPRRHCLDY